MSTPRPCRTRHSPTQDPVPCAHGSVSEDKPGQPSPPLPHAPVIAMDKLQLHARMGQLGAAFCQFWVPITGRPHALLALWVLDLACGQVTGGYKQIQAVIGGCTVYRRSQV